MKSKSNAANILENCDDGYFTLNHEWRFTYMNRRAAEIEGKEKEEIIGKIIWDSYPGLKNTLLEKTYRDAMEKGVIQRTEMQGLVTGSWYNIFAIPTDEGISVYWQDISGQKKQAKELKESEEKYHSLFQSMGEGFAIAEMEFDLKGKPVDYVILEINQAYEKQSGLSPEQVLGKRVTEFLDIVEPAWFEHYGKVVLSGEPQRFEEYNASLNRWFSVYAFPLPTKNRFGMIFSDITGRKRAEDALRESKEQYQRLFENSKYGFAVVEPLFDENGMINDLLYLQLNPAFERETGLSTANFLGKRLMEALPGIEPHWLDLFDKVMKSGEPLRCEKYNQDTSRWYEIVVFSYTNGLLGEQFIDITKRKKAEEELREKTKQLDDANRQKEDILESISDCFYVLDKDLRFTYVNKPAEEIWGLSRADLIGRKIEDVFPGIIDISLSKFHQVLEEQSYQHYEVYSKVINRWGDMGVYPIRDSISVYFRDTTERKQAEEALRESEKKALALVEELKALEDNLSNQVKVLSRLQDISSHFIRKDNIQTIYNEILKAAIEFTNADFGDMQSSRDDGRLELIVAQGYGETFLQYFHFVDGFYTTCAEAAKEGKRIITRNITQDPVYIGTPGLKVLLDEGIICIQSTPLFSRSGKLLGTLSTHYKQEHSFSEQELILLDIFARQAADVIERDQYEEVLHKTYLREEALGDLSNRLLESEDPQATMEEICRKSIGYVECDVFINYIAEEGHLRLNAYSGISNDEAEKIKHLEYGETVCGCTDAEGKKIVILDVQNSTDPRAQYVKSFGVQSYATFPLKSDDHVIGTLSFGSRKRKVFTEDELLFMNIVSGHIAIAINRLMILEALRESEKKALILVAELEKADENKNQFISVLSHELRNPLAAISAGVQILDVTEDINQTEKAKEIMKRQTNQLCKLVDDLLELTRITQNKIRLKKEYVNLNEIVKNAVEDIGSEYAKKGVKLDIKIQTKPVFLNADPVRITQMIGNILFNALKFTQANGVVWLTLKTEKKNAILIVKDNGIGLSSEILPHLFTPFTQAENTLARSSGGLGLGLSIVKGIVDLHEGTVSAFSDGLGKGSTFTIRLPITSGEKIIEKPSLGNNDNKSLKLLIIEDNRDFAELLSAMLSTIGYNVNIAFDGVGGIKQAKQIKPDIIFCDIGLPGINGYAVAESIRNDKELKDIKLIALTGYAGEGDVDRALKAGFNKHLAKPVDFESLKNVL
jgi:PAS domain S-box-containing protein